MRQIRARLTYANVMSSIAVFLVLGGGAAMAAQLAKNSVGPKQLKKNAVTSAKIKKEAITTAKIKKDAVTGDKANESTFGIVPTAALANSLPPLEATHLVGASGEPGFEGGSANFPGEGGLGFIPVGFYKDHEGIVHLQGIAKVGTGGSFVFTLPAGFRPPSGKLIIQEPIKESTVIIAGSNVSISGTDISGKILGSEGKPVVLDAITYKAES